MNRISVIISSFNQCRRLRHCLDRAVIMKAKFADDIEIIVADDNSTDGSIELLKRYPVKLCVGDNKNPGKYTLSDNWNKAAEMATGDRVLFTNGDHILTTWFADNHMDPVMENNIVFGPGYQTSEQAKPIILDNNNCYLDIIKTCEDKNMLLPDRRCAHQEGAAMTYNQEFTTDYPYGYNFSVMREHFAKVGGFNSLIGWGGEEEALCDKIIDMYPDIKVVSNCNSVVIHLWHPPLNLINRKSGDLAEYRF